MLFPELVKQCREEHRMKSPGEPFKPQRAFDVAIIKVDGGNVGCRAVLYYHLKESNKVAAQGRTQSRNPTAALEQLLSKTADTLEARGQLLPVAPSNEQLKDFLAENLR